MTFMSEIVLISADEVAAQDKPGRRGRACWRWL